MNYNKVWATVIFLMFLNIIFISSKPTRPIEGPLWIENRAMDDFANVFQNNQPENYEIYLPNKESYKNVNFDDFIFQTPSHKRALTMFGRWGPINDLGKERSSIRSIDRVHPSTGRKLGQPFRWG